MADEQKQEEKKCCDGKNVFGTFLKVLLGLAFIVIALYLLFGRGWWLAYTWPVIKGCAALFLILAGLITLAIAKE